MPPKKLSAEELAFDPWQRFGEIWALAIKHTPKARR